MRFVLFFLAASIVSFVSCVKMPVLRISKVTPSTQHSSVINVIQDIVKLRSETGGLPFGVWYHKGVLRNPMTGIEIAGIEGIELNRYLNRDSTLHASHNPNNAISTQPSIIHGDLFSSSYFSKKIFVYTDINNASQPLTFFRMNKLSPARKANPFKVFSEIITLGLDNRDRSFARIEFPNNRTVSTRKITMTNLARTTDATVTIPVEDSNQLEIVHFMSASRRKPLTALSRWVSFASSADDSRGRSQEYYRLGVTRPPHKKRGLLHKLGSGLLSLRSGVDDSSPSSPVATMQYQRFGEGPSWFSATRHPCSVEINSLKFRSPQHLPQSVLRLVNEVSPDFLPAALALTASGSDDDAVVRSFRTGEKDLLTDHKPWTARLVDWTREVVSRGGVLKK